PYPLPVAKTIAPLPATPAAYIFVAADGAMRVGASPAFAAATEVADLGSLAKLIPAAPGAAGWNTIGTGVYATTSGAPTGQGYAVSGRGTFVIHELVAERTAPADARVILVADRGAPLRTVGNIVRSSPEPIAVAVRGDDGAPGALALPLRGRSGGGAAVVQAVVLDAPATAAELVASIDAQAGGDQPVPITVRGASGGMRSSRINVPQVRIGATDVVGTLDKNIIRRYIRRNLSRITYCYEKQLLVKPGLEGTVKAEFVIGPQGNVPSSKATGMDPVVATCVAEVIHKIEFPKPQAGGVVKVSYPFTFNPTGG
ncbi:MAG: AgmX/PglI C-terminal domain-containing protein, partial [Deltaproteobacteria bacterium]|nr:AgmX/PglI C-terminal domain-containing protein [Kofleriaceae bacterium]